MSSPTPDSPTLLIVDDTPDDLCRLASLLSDGGFTVRKASSAPMALKSIAGMPPDLILLDISLPQINAYQLCQSLKSAVPPPMADIPIIFISALDNVFDKIKAFEAGGADYITKPFHPQEVVVRINHQLEIQSQKRQLQVEIAERRRAEKALEISLHVVSHDLRNPILGLSMILTHSLEHAAIDAETISLPLSTVEQMLKSCDRQLVFINSLAETHQYEKEGIALVRRTLDIKKLIHDFMATWALPLTKQAVVMTTHLSPNLPLIEADSDYLWRVLDNLLANALKYNPLPRQQTLQIELTATVTDSGLRCALADNGIGINPAIANKVFERYQRGEVQQGTAGLGLGLYLCRQIIQAHGGQIGLNLDRLTGTEVWFTLPLSGLAAFPENP